MLYLSSLITIVDPGGSNQIQLTFTNNIEIDKSRKNLTNTAKIFLPRNIKLTKADVSVNINSIIQRGASVNIELGYDGNLVSEFTGYVSEVNAKIPFEIKCQDEMWNLKQNSFTHTWQKVKVADIIKAVYSGPAQVVDLEIGGLIIKQQSTAQVLNGLRKFGLQCYFDNGTLIVDFAGVIHSRGNEVFYDFNKNVIENNLEFKQKEDARIKVIAISKLHTGKKIQITVGDNDGEIHTLHYVNIDEDQLQKIANAEIEKLKYDGYKGTYKTFGLPYALPGDSAVLHDVKYPERDGTYLIESVKTTFGVNGFRREIELERKLA